MASLIFRLFKSETTSLLSFNEPELSLIIKVRVRFSHKEAL